MTRILLALVLLLPSVALARDDGRYANSPLKDWVKGLKSERSGQAGCCDVADGFPAEVEYDMAGDRYRVRIDGKWWDVPDDAVIKEPNRLGYPMVWYYPQHQMDGDPRPVIRCFIPGAGG